MEKVEYKKVAELRNGIEESCQELFPKICELKEKLSQFYEYMRWHNIDCDEEKYSELYENMIYPYEENNIESVLSELVVFLNKDSRSE